ncbi:unnamed protein product [Haemonchus placei]|uniref:Uncharacterized protein n=1 Tax=Haemonchus placei TaxID=6290 RepID=A0A0N4W1X1_HAEPC|nr:unnamed protein product [Haemonchus placei]
MNVPTEDYDAMVRDLLTCAEQAMFPRVDSSVRISDATKELRTSTRMPHISHKMLQASIKCREQCARPSAMQGEENTGGSLEQR